MDFLIQRFKEPELNVKGEAQHSSNL